MAPLVKICGINSPEAMAAAVEAGAAFVGFVFFPRSPRHVTPEQARALAQRVPGGIVKVGLFVDPDDETLQRTLTQVPLDLLQLHGDEPPARVAEIKQRFGLPVMKVIKVSTAEDLAQAANYRGIADRLLFDAKPPKDDAKALPGGNAVSFDWTLLRGREWDRPWMLAGGLTADSLAGAVRISGAPAVDISSGVEDSPGVKNPEKIHAFLAAAKSL